MYDSVRNSFAAFSAPLEGSVPWMYQDTLGKVTIGIGNLIDSHESAWATRNFGGTFVHKDDMITEAGEAEVYADWDRVSGDPSLKGNWKAAEVPTNLRLTEAGVASLAANKLQAFEDSLRQTAEFAAVDGWPADAQLALFSIAWAQGTIFDDWPNFRAACAAQDWNAAVAQCNLGNQWLGKRNAVNRGMLRNARWAVDNGVDLSGLQLSVPGNRPTLSLGATDADHAGRGFDSDDSVSSLQRFLQYLGFGSADNGTFDEETDGAVRGFQSAENGLSAKQGGFTVDGEVGQMTWAALGFVVPQV